MNQPKCKTYIMPDRFDRSRGRIDPLEVVERPGMYEDLRTALMLLVPLVISSAIIVWGVYEICSYAAGMLPTVLK